MKYHFSPHRFFRGSHERYLLWAWFDFGRFADVSRNEFYVKIRFDKNKMVFRFIVCIFITFHALRFALVIFCFVSRIFYSFILFFNDFWPVFVAYRFIILFNFKTFALLSCLDCYNKNLHRTKKLHFNRKKAALVEISWSLLMQNVFLLVYHPVFKTVVDHSLVNTSNIYNEIFVLD